MCLHPFANYVIQDMIAFAPQSILHKLHRYGVTVPSHRCLLPPSQRPPTASRSRPPHTSACVRACVRACVGRRRVHAVCKRSGGKQSCSRNARVRPSVRQSVHTTLPTDIRRLRRSSRARSADSTDSTLA
jgi:hypothetical protein